MRSPSQHYSTSHRLICRAALGRGDLTRYTFNVIGCIDSDPSERKLTLAEVVTRFDARRETQESTLRESNSHSSHPHRRAPPTRGSED